MKITVNEYLGDDLYFKHTIILRSKESITPWSINNFRWEGEYKGQFIIVKLARKDPEEFANITKPQDLNISDQIIEEIKRVLKKLD